jgi:hypothetical protein
MASYKPMFITYGPYRGRVLQLEDNEAATAESDGWALPYENVPPSGFAVPADYQWLTPEDEPPASYTEWEQSLALTPDGNGGDGGEGAAPPEVTSLNPNHAIVGGPEVTMSVVGSGFSPDSVIVFNGGEEPTTFVSPTEVTTMVEPSTAVGPATVPVGVRDGGADSNTLPFTFTE